MDCGGISRPEIGFLLCRVGQGPAVRTECSVSGAWQLEGLGEGPGHSGVGRSLQLLQTNLEVFFCKYMK